MSDSMIDRVGSAIASAIYPKAGDRAFSQADRDAAARAAILAVAADLAASTQPTVAIRTA